MNFLMQVGDGQYTFTRRNKDTLEIIQETGPCHNLITNAGMDRLGNEFLFNSCFVGTGTQAPAFTDIALQTTRGVSTDQRTVSVTLDETNTTYWSQLSVTYRFAAGAASGNLSEVGVGSGTIGNMRLFSRARIVDTSGNPTTITVLADEVLDVTYSLRVYPDLTDKVSTLTLGGVVYTFRIRPLRIKSWRPRHNEYWNSFGATPVANASFPATIEGALQGSFLDRGSYEAGAFVAGAHRRDSTTAWGLTTGNHASGISGFQLTPWTGSTLDMWYGAVVTPPIPKNNTNTLSLTWRFTWARYAP